MRVENYQFPKSSFLSIEKDLDFIVKEMLRNDRLKKLLYYTTKDAMHKNNLSEDETLSLIGQHIRLVPKLTVDGDVLNYIVIGFDNFIQNATNPEFRDNTISFDIICHFNQWQLEGMQLRPYRIAAELDTMFNEKHLSGIGVLNFVGASHTVLNDEFTCFSLLYQAVHGEDDIHRMLNPNDNAQMIKDFNEMYNNK